ncbi:pilus assembly protein TadG-related protein [Intrasporangium calvum]|uniref:pilus assembly protein TadG-related protein n=1 Tax=Intrasporangium calvum TaxID=53358 RepID=UPI001F3BDA3C|nr:Tad domain-containing protein [Intrasporangium calvum]
MRKLTRPSFIRRLGDGERGTAAILFGVFVAGGVVIGMLALTVDVGNVMFERRQLQNGADATALALAQACAAGAGSSECDPAQWATLLDGNTPSDDESTYDTRRYQLGACGRNTGNPELDAWLCDELGNEAFAQLAECPPLPAWLKNKPIPYVETYSRSARNGDTILPAYFSQILTGNAGADLTACARAAWGPPGSASIPLTISTCEWEAHTSGGTDWVEQQPSGPKPGYGPDPSDWPDPSRELVVRLHDPNDTDQGCDWNGKDTAGGFGWVANEDCKALVTTDDWVQIDTGNDVPNDCKSILPGLVGTAVSIPVFDCIIASGTTPTGPKPTEPEGVCNPEQKDAGGAKSWYHLAGWAKFYVSGYYFSGLRQDSILPSGGHTSCGAGGGDRCIYGWFLKGVLSDAEIDPDGTGPDFGAYVVRAAG